MADNINTKYYMSIEYSTNELSNTIPDELTNIFYSRLIC